RDRLSAHLGASGELPPAQPREPAGGARLGAVPRLRGAFHHPQEHHSRRYHPVARLHAGDARHHARGLLEPVVRPGDDGPYPFGGLRRLGLASGFRLWHELAAAFEKAIFEEAMPLYELDGIRPQLPAEGTYWIAPSADLIGHIFIAEE